MTDHDREQLETEYLRRPANRHRHRVAGVIVSLRPEQAPPWPWRATGSKNAITDIITAITAAHHHRHHHHHIGERLASADPARCGCQTMGASSRTTMAPPRAIASTAITTITITSVIPAHNPSPAKGCKAIEGTNEHQRRAKS